MAILDHWHPVLLTDELRDRPVAVRLAGKELVLFRGADGRVGALEDCCPHRRMRLSLGRVVGGRLRCPYHGWTFDGRGCGESPGTPKLHACAPAFDALERHGAVWVKARDARPEFPAFDTAGHYPVGVLRHRVRAPMELVVDNFCETEHTATTHAYFGYSLEAMSEVDVRCEPGPATVRVTNEGPSRPLPWLLRRLLGVGPGFRFHDQWTTYFSPVYSVFDHWWSDPATGREGRVRWRVFVFFCPADEQETTLVSFAYGRSRYPGPARGARVVRVLMRRMLAYEIRQDIALVENLVDKSPAIEGMKLSRFDRTLGLNRERIDRLYRGRPAAVGPVPG